MVRDSLPFFGMEHAVLEWSTVYWIAVFIKHGPHILLVTVFFSAAAVICRGYSTENIHVCERGDVRLLNETQPQVYKQGRVEICYSGKWVGICSNYLSNTFVRLTCQKLLGRSQKGKITIDYTYTITHTYRIHRFQVIFFRL